MDACDPGIDFKNLKSLIKQNTGQDLKLTRKQICNVYSTTQDGKLPLPPLILSSDRTFLLDRKSPLTRIDFDKLFNSTTKVASIRRIAKKVGVSRHADTKLTKQELIGIIGRRLHSMNILEPVKLRSLQSKKIKKFNVNTSTNNNVPFGNDVNRINNVSVRRENNTQNIQNGITRPNREKQENNTKSKTNIYNNSKKVNRGQISLYEKYHGKSSGSTTLSNNQLAAYKANRRKFYQNKPENAYTKLRAQGKIEIGYAEFKRLFRRGKDKYVKNVNTGNASEIEGNDNVGIERPSRKGQIVLSGKGANNNAPEPDGEPNSLPPTKENRQKLVNNKQDPISLWLNKNSQKNGFGNLYNNPEAKNVINEVREKYVTSGNSKTGDISRVLSTLRGKNPKMVIRGQNTKVNTNLKKLRNFLQNKNINNGRKALYEGKVRNGSNVDAVINMIKQQLEKSNTNISNTNSSNTIPNKPVNKPNVPIVPKSKLNTDKNAIRNYLKQTVQNDNVANQYLKMLNNGKNVNNVKKVIEADLQKKLRETKNIIAFDKYLENKSVFVNTNAYRNRLKKGEQIEKLKSEIGNIVTEKRRKMENKNSLTKFLNNKNVPNKNTYFVNLNRGKPIVEIKKAIMNKQTDMKNKEEMNKRVQEISVLLNSNSNLKNNANVKAILNNYATGRKQKIKGWLFNTNGNVMYKNINSVKSAINTMKKQLALRNEIEAKKTNINMYVNSKGLKNPKKVKKGALAQINQGVNVNTVKSGINTVANNEKAANEAAEAKRIKAEEAAEAKRIKAEEAAEAKRIKNEEAAEAKRIKAEEAAEAKRIKNEEAAAEAQRKKNEEEQKKQEARNEKARQRNELQQFINSENSNNRVKMNAGTKAAFLKSFNTGAPLGVVKGKVSQYFTNKKTSKSKENNRKQKRTTLKQILNSKNNNANIKLNNATKDKHLKAFNNGGNFNRVKANAIKSIQNKQTAKKQRLAEEENKQRKLQILTQILSSKNSNANVKLNNARKAEYLQQFNKNPDTFNIIKGKITKEITNKVTAKAKKAAEADKKRAERQKLEQLLKTSNSINTTYYIGLFNQGQSYNAVKQQINNKLANIKSRKNAANELKKQQEIAKKAAGEAKRKEDEARRKAMENKMYFNEQSQLESQKAANNARKAKEEAARKVEEAKKMKQQKRVQDKKVIQSMIQRAGGISINGPAYLSKLNANTYNFNSIKKALIANIKTKKNAKKAVNITKQKENIVRKNLELRKGLERKVQRAQFKNDSNKRKLLNQIKNTKSMTAKELQPKINKAIKELSLNGNINNKEEKRKRDLVKKQVSEYISKTYPKINRAKRTDYIKRANSYREGSGMFYRMRPQSYNAIKKMINQNMKPPPPQKNKKANLKKLVNNTLKGRAGKNASRLKKNINEGVSEMTVKTRLAQLNKQTKYQTK
tara:strand:+ start:4068 stop:8342 length:4275 start_codon:yes stop_codon:yes gene_type:complete